MYALAESAASPKCIGEAMGLRKLNPIAYSACDDLARNCGTTKTPLPNILVARFFAWSNAKHWLGCLEQPSWHAFAHAIWHVIMPRAGLLRQARLSQHKLWHAFTHAIQHVILPKAGLLRKARLSQHKLWHTFTHAIWHVIVPKAGLLRH